MNATPIINASSAANSGAAPGPSGAASPSDQSFGQVLSREVGDRNNANQGPSAAGNPSGNQATTPGAPAAAAAKAKAADDKAKKTADTSASQINNALGNGAESAQILALVANVQQSDSGIDGASAASPSADSALAGKIIGTVGASGNTIRLDSQSMAASGSVPLMQTTSASALAQADLATAGNITETDAASGGAKSKETNLTTGVLALANAKSVKPEPITFDVNGTVAQPGAQAVPVSDLAAAKSALTSVPDLTIPAKNAATAAQTVAVAPTAAVPQPLMFNAQLVSGSPGEKLTPPVGSSGWDQALGQKVVWMVAGGQQSASLTLNPPDLGPMQVVLNVNNSHATATFTAAQPEVRQALEAAMPKLREMLGVAGIQLGQTSVNSGAAQQQQTAFGGQHSQAASQSANQSDAGDIPAVVVGRSASISSGQGMVDTFA